MNNLAALGVGRLLPATVLGDDGQAYDLLKALERLPVDAGYVVQDAERLTPTYTKPMQRDGGGTWRELNRLDLRNRKPMSRATLDRLLEQISRVFSAADGLIIVDQVNEEDWGVVTGEVREHLAALCRTAAGQAGLRRQPHANRALQLRRAETKRGRVPRKSGESERRSGAVRPGRHESGGAAPLAQTGCPLFCTLGDRGMLAVGFADGDQRPEAIEAAGYPVQGPTDIVGAGDSATAGIVASLLAGANPSEAAAVGNLVASITVQQLGTTGTASPAQLAARWQQCHAS